MSDQKRPEVETLILGQPGQQPRNDLTALANLLERCGHSPEEARALALEAIQKQAHLDPGVTFGHLHAEQLADLWKRAARYGKRKLVLEISADALSSDEWDGHIRVEVKDAQTWQQFEDEQREARQKEVN